jgi:hypothetical protein
MLQLRLTHLILAGSEYITSHGIASLLPLAATLATLDLTDCYRIDDAALGHAVQLTSLEHLSIAGCRNVTDVGAIAISMLPSLRFIDVSRCRRLTDKVPTALSEVTQLITLRMAHLSQITDASLRRLRSLSALSTLCLSGCTLITREGLACLPPNLGTLLLRGCPKIDDPCVSSKTIASAGKLITLELSGCPITDAGLHDISINFRKLSVLRLISCSSVTDTGLSSLRELPSILTEVNLAYCTAITDAGLLAVTEANAPRLERLSIRGCLRLSDSAMGIVGKHATRLTYLDISCTEVTDSGLRHLELLRRLLHLGVQYCAGVSDGAVQRLLLALPQLQSLEPDRLCDNNLRKANGGRPQRRLP